MEAHMLAREMLIKQFEYNAQANGRIFDQAEHVSDEQWTAPKNADGRSLQELLRHMLTTERVWRLTSAHGSVDLVLMPAPEQIASVPSMREFANEEAGLMLALLQDWSDEAFADVVMATRWDGQQMPLVRWHMLQHLLLHSMQHRSEAAALLTSYGRSPGNLDFIFFDV
jgi:uncharacterized damage-inducible protein DinB